MDLFKLVGRLSIEGTNQANNDILSVTGTAQKAKGIFDTTLGKIAGVVGTAFATDKIISFGKDLYQTSAEVQAENAQFSASFKDLANVADDMFKRVADSTGVFASRLKVTGTKAYSQFKGAGMDANESLKKTETFLNLASDASAYYDISLEDAEARIRSFLRGNVEAGDAIGLFTSASQRNTYAIDLYGKKWIDLTEAQKQNLMLNVAEDIYKQSGAIGQAQRESDGLANVMGNLQEVWRQFKAQIGAPLLASVVPIFQKITDKLISIKKYLDENKDAMNGFKSIVSAFGGVLDKTVDGIINIVGWLGKHQKIVGFCTDAMKLLLVSFIAFKSGAKIQSVVQGFQQAQVALSLFKLETKGASIVQGVLNGQLTIGQTVVGLLTGKMKLAELVTGLWAKGQMVLNAVLTANPIGVVVMAIAGLIAIVVIAYNKCDWFRNGINKLWNTVKNFFANLPQNAKKAFDSFIKFMQNLPEKTGYFIGLVIGKIARFVVDLGKSGVKAGSGFVNGIINFFKNLPSNLWNLLVSAYNSAVQFGSDMINKAIQIGQEFPSKLLEWFKSLPNNLTNIGGDIVRGLWNGITSGYNWLKDKVTGFCKGIIDGFKKGFDTHSPSRITTWIGQMLTQGIGVGVESDDSAEKSIKNKVNSVIGIANNSLSNIKVGANFNNFKSSNPLQEYQLSIDAQMSNLNNGIDKLTNLIASYLPQIAENSDKPISIDGNSLAVGMRRQIDYQLGRLSVGKGRGNV